MGTQAVVGESGTAPTGQGFQPLTKSLGQLESKLSLTPALHLKLGLQDEKLGDPLGTPVLPSPTVAAYRLCKDYRQNETQGL
jgi:hypothetical protein